MEKNETETGPNIKSAKSRIPSYDPIFPTKVRFINSSTFLHIPSYIS